MGKINILGTNVDNLSLAEAGDRIWRFVREGGFHYVLTPNSEILMCAERDDAFRAILNGADMLVPDGIGVVHASRILGAPLKERVAGYDLLVRLLETADGQSLYLFGGKPCVVQKARENIALRYPGVHIVGVSDGYFDPAREREILDDINAKSPDILAVCLGSPKQEYWLDRHKERLNVRVAMGVGGSVDVLAGEVRRAPDIFIRLGLEWLYRITTQPKRIIRALDLPRFACAVMMSKFRKG